MCVIMKLCVLPLVSSLIMQMTHASLISAGTNEILYREVRDFQLTHLVITAVRKFLFPLNVSEYKEVGHAAYYDDIFHIHLLVGHFKNFNV